LRGNTIRGGPVGPKFFVLSSEDTLGSPLRDVSLYFVSKICK